MGEILEGLFLAIQVVVELLLRLIANSFLIVVWCCSKRFRERKRVEWAQKKFSKHIQLGWSGLCFAALLALPIAAFLPESKKEKNVGLTFWPERAGTNEDFRLRLWDTNRNDTNWIISVNRGGTARILTTKTMEDLKKEIVANVKVLRETSAPSGEFNATNNLATDP